MNDVNKCHYIMQKNQQNEYALHIQNVTMIWLYKKENISIPVRARGNSDRGE